MAKKPKTTKPTFGRPRRANTWAAMPKTGKRASRKRTTPKRRSAA